MKKITLIVLFIFMKVYCPEDGWQMVLSENVGAPKDGWTLVTGRDLVPPPLPAAPRQTLANGKPVPDSFRVLNPGQPIRHLAQKFHEQDVWQRYLLRDRRRRWLRSIIAYADSVARIMPEIAAGIIEIQTR